MILQRHLTSLIERDALRGAARRLSPSELGVRERHGDQQEPLMSLHYLNRTKQSAGIQLFPDRPLRGDSSVRATAL